MATGFAAQMSIFFTKNTARFFRVPGKKWAKTAPLRAKNNPFWSQKFALAQTKVSFLTLKGNLSHPKRYPFIPKKVTFYTLKSTFCLAFSSAKQVPVFATRSFLGCCKNAEIWRYLRPLSEFFSREGLKLGRLSIFFINPHPPTG